MLLSRTPQPNSLDLELEGSIWIGIVLAAILYGVYLGVYYLFILALFTNCQKDRAGVSYRRNCFMIAYSSLQLILNTLFFLSFPYLGQLMWIIHRNNHIGGPAAYFDMEYGHADYTLLSGEAGNFATFLADAVLTYRCYVIFGSNLYVVLIPGLLNVSVFALGVATTSLMIHDTEANTKLPGRLSAAGIVLTTFSNVLVTIMISWRILSVLYRVRKHANSTTSRLYTNVVAILIESAAPSALLGIIISAVNTYSGVDDQLPWTFGLYLTWCMVIVSYPGILLFVSGLVFTGASCQALSPQLIMYRMAKGIAWTTDSTTVTEVNA